MNWNEILGPVLATKEMADLKAFIKAERMNKKIHPDGKSIFRAFDLCPYDNTKVVILGQDPYASDHADGLAFSSKLPERPKSLEVIFKEIYQDLNIQYFHNITLDEFFPTNDLTNWTKEGFLLLNTVLTVEDGKPGSHKGKGWEMVIDAVFKALNEKKHQVVFLLWGKEAQEYKDKITNPMHLYLEAPHPAAELHKADGPKFTGCRHFSIVRDIIPMIHNQNIYKTVELDACFDKEKAKAIVREHYPIEADKICNYIDKDLIIHVPVNRDNYFQELKRIESSFSTKPVGP
jgi:uracil-DNA glycosylase